MNTVTLTQKELTDHNWTQLIAEIGEGFLLLTPSQIIIWMTQDLRKKETKATRIMELFGLNPVMAINTEGYVAFSTHPEARQEIAEKGWTPIVNSCIGTHSGTSGVVMTIDYITAAKEIAEQINATAQSFIEAISSDIAGIKLIRLDHEVNKDLPITNLVTMNGVPIEFVSPNGTTSPLIFNLVGASSNTNVIEAVELINGEQLIHTGNLIIEDASIRMDWDPTTVVPGTSPTSPTAN